MKTLYCFAYCSGGLHPNVRWYLVKVGISKRDRQAYLRVRSIANASCDYLLCKYSQDVVHYIDKVANSFWPAERADAIPTYKLRRLMCNVTWLSSFLARFPHAMLNSDILPNL